MRYSRLFPKTIKQTPQDATLMSHKLLYRGGYIRDSVAGRYYLLPLGLRVHRKIQDIIKEEMDKSGAQELVTPVLHPISLWQETNRTNSVGFELMTIKDRNDFEFVLGGTAEEMLVDLVRKFQVSYKELPFNLYQFSTKFRDELRAKGGLLRLREFVMKDAYSFDADEAGFQKEYQKMWNVYKTIFDRVGLKTTVIESDNGYIGGEYCHEFVVESAAGESKCFVSSTSSYAAHEDITKFVPDKKNVDEEEKQLQEVDAVRGPTMEDGVKLHNLPLWQQIKDVMFVDEKGRFILAVIRGDYDVNEVKLLHAIQSYQVRPATEEEIITKLHSYPGFISPVGIKNVIEKDLTLVIVADESLHTVKNAYGGANKQNKDLLNINIGRDFQSDLTADIALAQEGFQAEDGGELIAKRGIEVGNIFQLGFHYSSKMQGAEFVNKEGKLQPYYMGCYGIGIARTLATIVEEHHDDKGIIWPDAVAPYTVYVVGLDLETEEVKKLAETVYEEFLSQGVEVLFDDRVGISAGEKFADADLIGIPYRVVISKRTTIESIEYKKRAEVENKHVSLKDLVLTLKG